MNLDLSEVTRVLFVCTHNEYRSAIAEAIFNHLCRAQKVAATATSAGTEAWPDSPAAREAISLVERLGYDLKHHSTRVLTNRAMESCHVVVCMSQRHISFVREHFPTLEKPVRLLKAVAQGRDNDPPRPEDEIHDPAGGGRKELLACLMEINEDVQHLVARLATVRRT